MKNEDHWFADLVWPDEKLKLLVCRLSLTNFALISGMSSKVWYLDEEWKLLVCRLGLAIGIVCRLRLLVWFAELLWPVLHYWHWNYLRAETVCCVRNVCTRIVYHSMIGLRILMIRAEWKGKEEVKKCWDRVEAEQSIGRQERRRVAEFGGLYASNFDIWITRQSREDYGSLEERQRKREGLGGEEELEAGQRRSKEGKGVAELGGL